MLLLPCPRRASARALFAGDRNGRRQDGGRRRGRASSPVALLAALGLLQGCAGTDKPGPLRADLLLRGGLVVDGTGAPPRRADVAVRADRILFVGDAAGRIVPQRELDARGLAVAPGFVDLHSHADLNLLAGPDRQQELLRAKILQGVTTIVVGNCGLGAAPADEGAARVLAGINGWMTPEGVTLPPLSVADYLDRVERDGVVLNVAALVPHGPVRISAMGLAPGGPSPVQLEQMRRLVARSLEEGAFGLSAGLIYPPGMYAPTEELVALAEEVAARDRVFTCHVRGSSETLLEATGELLEIARRSRARVHHSHLEAVGERFWPLVAEVLAREDEAREDGLSVSHDVFPYTRAATMMSAIFPPWALEGGIGRLLDRLRDPAVRERIRHEVETRRPEWPPWKLGGWPHNLVEAVGWDAIYVASVGPAGPAELAGRSLAEIAAAEGRAPFDVVASLMLSEEGRVGQLVGEISGSEGELDALHSILRHPAAVVITDAEDYGRGIPHPAHAGAFARALRLARDTLGMPLEEIVHRMTGRPASLLRLRDRGVLREGAFADLVAFDPLRVRDRATWEDPRRAPDGIVWVLVNGTVVAERGELRGGAVGRVLRAGRTASEPAPRDHERRGPLAPGRRREISLLRGSRARRPGERAASFERSPSCAPGGRRAVLGDRTGRSFARPQRPPGSLVETQRIIHVPLPG